MLKLLLKGKNRVLEVLYCLNRKFRKFKNIKINFNNKKVVRRL